MSKATPSKPDPTVPAGDTHERIASEAAQCRNNPGASLRDAEETPALSGLFDSARSALEKGIPARFEHKGRTYFLRVSVGLALLAVFDSASAPQPMATAMSGSIEEYGHQPLC